MKLQDIVTGEWIECTGRRWDRKLKKWVEFTEGNGEAASRRNGTKFWVAFRYREQLALARQTRNALLAVQAELHRLYFQAWNKKAPVEFNNSALRELSFSHHEKIRALKALESAGWVTVRWRERKSPLVRIIRGFQLGR